MSPKDNIPNKSFCNVISEVLDILSEDLEDDTPTRFPELFNEEISFHDDLLQNPNDRANNLLDSTLSNYESTRNMLNEVLDSFGRFRRE